MKRAPRKTHTRRQPAGKPAAPAHAAAWVLAAAARAVAAVVEEGRNADAALEPFAGDAQRRAISAVTLGSLRWYLRLAPAIMPLLARDASQTPALLRCLLAVAAHQLEMSRNPPESIVSSAVDAARALQLAHAAGTVNAVLRRWLRERETLLAAADTDLAVRTAHPEWLVRELGQHWPEEQVALLEANNEHPPLTLRVNLARTGVAASLARLQAAGIEADALAWLPGAITVRTPVAVRRLPGFSEGELSVQDASAQLAARLLAPQRAERILDACAAPGGKTCGLLELAPECRVTAVDVDAVRLQRVADNLARLQQQAELVAADLADPHGWQPPEPFDAILVDAPCTATGVIRRHPDIKLLRRASDLPALVERQRRILVNCWRMLRPGGRLLYVTCSVLPQENSALLAEFLAAEPQARELDLPLPPEGLPLRRTGPGWQLLTGGAAGADGFHYVLLTRVT